MSRRGATVTKLQGQWKGIFSEIYDGVHFFYERKKKKIRWKSDESE